MDEYQKNQIDSSIQRFVAGARGYANNENYTGFGYQDDYAAHFDKMVNAQREADNIYEKSKNKAKSLYNGFVVQTAQGLIGTYEGALDYNLARRQKAAEDDNVYVGKNSESEYAKWSRERINDLKGFSPFQRYEVNSYSALDAFGNALAEGAGQLAFQTALAMGTGGLGNLVKLKGATNVAKSLKAFGAIDLELSAGSVINTSVMWTQIFGNQYLELKEKGVNPTVAANMAAINATVQAPLEQISLGRMMKAVPVKGTTMARQGKDVLGKMLTEGVTEFLQQYPEEITNLIAENPNASAAELWEMSNQTEWFKNALYAGSIGFLLAGGHGSVNLAFQHQMHKGELNYINKTAKETVLTAQKDGVKEEDVRNYLNAKNGMETVEVDAEALQTYMQQASDPKSVLETLRIDEGALTQAVENGETVEILKGDYTMQQAKDENFTAAVGEYTSFASSEFTPSNEEQRKKIANIYMQTVGEQIAKDEAYSEQLATLAGQLESSMKAVGGKNAKAIANAWIKGVIDPYARRMNPYNPSQALLEFPLTVIGVDENGIPIVVNENGETVGDDSQKITDKQLGTVTKNISQEANAPQQAGNRGVDMLRQILDKTELGLRLIDQRLEEKKAELENLKQEFKDGKITEDEAVARMDKIQEEAMLLSEQGKELNGILAQIKNNLEEAKSQRYKQVAQAEEALKVVESDGATELDKIKAMNDIDSAIEGMPVIEFNITTAKEGRGREYLLNRVAEYWGADQVEPFKQFLDDAISVMEEVMEENPEFETFRVWQSKTAPLMLTDKGYVPVISGFKSNGEYAYNYDLGTLCIKSESIVELMKIIKEKGYFERCKALQYQQCIDLLARYKLAIPCKMCFVNGKRVKVGVDALKQSFEWESVLRACGIKDDYKLGDTRNDIPEGALEKLEAMANGDDLVINGETQYQYDENGNVKVDNRTGEPIAKKGFHDAYNRLMPVERRRTKNNSNQDLDSGITADKMQRIASIMLERKHIVDAIEQIAPEDRTDVQIATLQYIESHGGVFGLVAELDASGLATDDYTTMLKMNFADTSLGGLLGGWFGAGTAKPVESHAVYHNLSWLKDFNEAMLKVNKAATEEERAKEFENVRRRFFNIGGFRMQSVSDFNSYQTMDVIQAMLDLEARFLPLHLYTKVPAEIELFDGSGAKMNMSLIPNAKPSESIPDDYLGLRRWKDGDGEADYIDDKGEKWMFDFAEESFPPDKAFDLRKKSSGDAGTIMVAISKHHLLAALRSNKIDMVIPYHASSMPFDVKILTGFDRAQDYTDWQTTGGRTKEQADFNFNEVLHYGEYVDGGKKITLKEVTPKTVADEYIKFCKRHHFTPKFDFLAGEENYYKVLADFRVYDNDGNVSHQGPVHVRDILSDRERFKAILKENLGEREQQIAHRKEVFADEGFLAELDKIFEYQPLDGEIRQKMYKALSTALGKDGIKFYKTEEFETLLRDTMISNYGEAAGQRKTIELLKDTKGEVMGFAEGGTIYLNEEYINANTPAHEFTHLWVKVARERAPQAWAALKAELKAELETNPELQAIWNEVAAELNLDYRYINNLEESVREDAFISEVLARVVGKKNEEIVKALSGNKKLATDEKGNFIFDENGMPKTVEGESVKMSKGAQLVLKIMNFVKKLFAKSGLFQPQYELTKAEIKQLERLHKTLDDAVPSDKELEGLDKKQADALKKKYQRDARNKLTKEEKALLTKEKNYNSKSLATFTASELKKYEKAIATPAEKRTATQIKLIERVEEERAKQADYLKELGYGDYIGMVLSDIWNEDSAKRFATQKKIAFKDIKKRTAKNPNTSTAEMMVQKENATSNQDVAEQKLVEDEAAFSSVVDDLYQKPLHKKIPLMHTPLVMQLAGFPNLSLHVTQKALKNMLEKHGPENGGGMTKDVLKKLPRAFTDPLFIARSKGLKLVALELRDKNNVSVVSFFAINQDDSVEKINLLAEAYGKDSSRENPGAPLKTNVEWFIQNFLQHSEKMLYVNKEKTTNWLTAEGVNVPQRLTQLSGLTDSSIPHEEDFVKLKNENPTMYQKGDKTKGSISFNNGRAVISLFKGADATTVIHETGHYFIENLIRSVLSGKATELQKQDLKKLFDYCGIKVEDWNGMSTEEKTKAHEKLAEAFETYLMEGKAPAKGLQAVFKRIKDWMLAVYKNTARNANAKDIDDNVREVFDHMLATEEELAQVERINGYFAGLPKFVTDKLSDKAKKQLANAVETAKDSALSILTKQAMVNFNVDRKEAIENYRLEIAGEITEQVRSEPLYVASMQVDNMFSAKAKTIAKKYIDGKDLSPNFSDGGIETFNVLAETNGFSSGDELAKAIIENPTEAQAIKERINAKVQEKFPDIMAERKAAEEAAQQSFYNDESGVLVALEQVLIEEALEEAIATSASDLAKARLEGTTEEQKKAKEEQRKAENEAKKAETKARQEARKERAAAVRQMAINAAESDIQNNLTMRELKNVRKFIVAERNAAAKSATALAKKDYETALKYKQMQIYNHAMVQASLRARDTYTKGLKVIKAANGSKRDAWLNEEHFSQLGAFLARLGIARRGYNPSMKEESFREYLIRMQEQYDCVEIAPWLIEENPIGAPDQLSLSQFEDVVDAVRNLRAIVKAAKGEDLFMKGQDYATLKQELYNALAGKPDLWTPNVNEVEQANPFAKYLASMKNMDTFFEEMDGYEYGFFSKLFAEKVTDANDKEFFMMREFQNRLGEAYKEWLPDRKAEKAADHQGYYDELKTSVDKHILIKMLMYLGSESSSNKLCSNKPGGTYWEFFSKRDEMGNIIEKDSSPLWTDDVNETRANLIGFLSNVLTAEDVRYAQKMVDAMGMYWDELSAMERRTKGFKPKKVAAVPVVLETPNGTLYFEGGYVPLVRRHDSASVPMGMQVIDMDEQPRGAGVKTMHTNTGSTKARDGSIYPLDLRKGIELGSVQETIHDICFRELVAGYRKLINDREVYVLLKNKLGVANMRVLEEFLTTVAKPYGQRTGGQADQLFGSAAQWIRARTVNTAIVFNLKTAAQNLSNIALYGDVVDGFGYKDVILAYTNWLNNTTPAEEYGRMEFIKQKSAFMAERMECIDVSIRDIKEGTLKVNPVEKAIGDIGQQIMVFTDNISAVPVWYQAFAKKIGEGATEREAVMFADTVIRRTLGSSRMTDVSAFQRGGQLSKLFTVFQGFFITQYNQALRMKGKSVKLWDEGKKGEAVRTAFAYLLSKWLIACLLNVALGLENPFEEENPDARLGTTKLGKELIHYPIGQTGPLAAFIVAGTDKALKINSLGYRGTPVDSMWNTIYRAIGKINSGLEKDDYQGMAEGVTSVAGQVTGTPAQFNKLFWNGWDVVFNGMDLEWGDLFRRRPKRDR